MGKLMTVAFFDRLVRFLNRTIFKDCYRDTCKCCGTKLHRPGGYGAAWIGPGFCGGCVTKILKGN